MNQRNLLILQRDSPWCRCLFWVKLMFWFTNWSKAGNESSQEADIHQSRTGSTSDSSLRETDGAPDALRLQQSSPPLLDLIFHITRNAHILLHIWSFQTTKKHRGERWAERLNQCLHQLTSETSQRLFSARPEKMEENREDLEVHNMQLWRSNSGKNAPFRGSELSKPLQSRSWRQWDPS